MLDTLLHFYPLTFAPDQEGIVVGRPGTSSFAVFPPEGVALLQRLQEGYTPKCAAQWYEQEYSETVDIEDFLTTLRELEFTRSQQEVTVATRSVSPFARGLGRLLFSYPAWCCYCALSGYCLYILVHFPRLLPTYQHVYISTSITVIEIGLLLGQLPGLLLHEAFHKLAMNRLGLASSLSLGNRLQYLVLETDLTDLWSVPRSARYLPYLAGMLADAIWFSMLTILASLPLPPSGTISFLQALCLAMAFTTVMRFLWQFRFYMKTDLYYVFSNLSGCINLHNVTQEYILDYIYRLARQKKSVDKSQWSTRDRKVASWYAPFYLGGYMITLGILLFVSLPIIIHVFSLTIQHLLVLHNVLSFSFWDACISSLLSLMTGMILLGILWKRWRRKKVQYRC